MKKLLIISAVFITSCTATTDSGAPDVLPDVPHFTPSADLESDFMTPPDYARPRVFWWWLEGYITEEGIYDDLVAMKDAGIAGAIVFDAGSSGYYTGGKMTYHNQVLHTPSGPGFMTDTWKRLFKYACRTADSLGIELSMNITSGWNDGGPWVTPEYTSQKLVWSETVVDVADKTAIEQELPLPKGLMKWKDTLWYRPVAVMAIKLTPEADSLKPLPLFSVKSVHSISIPQTPNKLGYDWEALVKPLPDELQGRHASLDDVIDVSDKVDANGLLRWQAPAGRYAILRFVQTGTGARVSTHSPGAGGLAIDYMNDKAMDLQFDNVVKPVLEDLRSSGVKGLCYLHDDSWELGAANWTFGFEEAFRKLNKYEIRSFLPVIAGKIIDSYDTSDRFLYDFRRTVAELICEKHYAHFRELAHANGLGIHPESGGPHPAPIDALKNMGQGDIPMGEFWAIANTHRIEPHQRLFVKQGASAAHIYGKRFMQAEGPTTIGPHWERSPRMLKPTLDRVFCEGLNRFVIHTFTHSPREAGKPGYEYFAGTHINPNITWWKQANAFFDWTSRNCFLLSQGLFVADVALWYGDNVPNQVPMKHIIDGLGEGYDYDAVNTDVILNRMTVRDGRICLPDGMSYSLLVLPQRKAILPEALEKIEKLVSEGATVYGVKPETSVGLRNKARAESKVRKIAARLWGDEASAAVGERRYGKGLVVWGKPLREVLLNKGVKPDFEYTSGGALIDYIHRIDSGKHYYLVANRAEETETVRLRFRVSGLAPELWNPITGERSDCPSFSESEGITEIPLTLEPYGSMFVVFRKEGAVRKEQLSYSNVFTVPVTDKWEVSFDTAWGGPATVQFNKLVLWNEHPDPRIKYYSGTGIYRCKVHSSLFKKSPAAASITLDLGELYNLAEVYINGKPAGVWWQPPYRKDITSLLQEGDNAIEIRVVNMWPNRLIGDSFLPVEKRRTKTNVAKFNKDTPLLPSGLAGPVILYVTTTYAANDSK